MAMSMGSFASRVVATQVVAKDGTGDFTDIQSAIDALPSAGGVVYIKEGTYSSASTITIDGDKVSVIGAGPSTIISIAATYALQPLFSVTSNNVLLDKFSMARTGIYAAEGIVADAVSNITVREISTSANYGILTVINNSDRIIVTGCSLAHTSDILSAQDSASLSNVVLADNIATSNGSILAANTITDSAITGNVCSGLVGEGIYALTSERNTFSNNIITGVAYLGIHLALGSENVISSNVVLCTKSYGRGILLYSVDDTVVVGNVAKGTVTGLHISQATSNDNVVVGNRLSGFTDGGTDTVDVGNSVV